MKLLDEKDSFYKGCLYLLVGEEQKSIQAMRDAIKDGSSVKSIIVSSKLLIK